MTDTTSQRFYNLVCGLLFMLLLFIFLKNAWVCDDAYINFRSLEQLFAGNGPNWNPHQRVQCYTSPLWYWLLASFRLVSADHFFNVILLSLVLFLMLGMVLQRYFGHGRVLAFALLLAAGSNAFFDFTTSGLENMLGYLLVSVALLAGFAAQKSVDGGQRNFRLALLAFSLVGICRHDLLILTMPAALILIADRQKDAGRSRLGTYLAWLAPLGVWSLFSLTYYGALFPNTAYAKLLTGIERWELLAQGWRYIQATLNSDPVTLLVLFAGIVAAWLTGSRYGRAIALGLVANLAYVVWVGGDFMRGRFLALPFLVALLLVAESRCLETWYSARPALGRILLGVFLVFLLAFPHTPVNTWLNFQDFSLEHGIADERGYYFDVCSLHAYLYSRPGEVFPDFEWSQIGRQIAVSEVAYLENDFNGMLGYWAGIRPIIIDRLALTDPFLARLAVTDRRNWRIGHFKREVPDAYRLSVETGENRFKDPASAALYEKIILATCEPQLFSFKRWLAIVKLNAGLD